MPGQSSHFTPALPLTSQPQPCGRAGFSGFPSPAQDYEPCTLDLNTRLVKNPTETFYVTATGDSMEVGEFLRVICWWLIAVLNRNWDIFWSLC